MLKISLLLLIILPYSVSAQETENLGTGNENIMFILQMNSHQIGQKDDINLKSNKFERHPLSGGDSLLVTASKDSVLYTINPDFIDEIQIIKNTPEVSRYTTKEIQGLVIIKFKNEQQYLSVISNE